MRPRTQPTPPPKATIIPPRIQRIPDPPPSPQPTAMPSAQIVWASDNTIEHVRDRRVRVVLSPGEDWSASSIPSDVEVEEIIEPEGNFTNMYLLKFPETFHGDLAVVFLNNKTSKPFRVVWNPNVQQTTAKPFVPTPTPAPHVNAVVLPANAWTNSTASTVEFMTSPFSG